MQMALDRLTTGEKVAGVSAVLLFAFTFLEWFSLKISAPGVSATLPEGHSAWDSLDLIPIVLMVAIGMSLINVVLRLSDSSFEPTLSLNTVVAILGAASYLLILYRVIDSPSFGEISGVSVDGTPELGIFLGLLAAAGIAIGGYLGVREERGLGEAERLSSP
jgi:hypothetical protein